TSGTTSGRRVLIADVNVFVGAHRDDVAGHDDYLNWLERSLTGPEAFGVSELVLSAFLRLVTNHRVFADPTPVGDALEFCRVVSVTPATWWRGRVIGTGPSSPTSVRARRLAETSFPTPISLPWRSRRGQLS
ncbi:MAG TPA: hypothetical protein VII33_00335, partial [Nakamurella sp.]